MTAVLERPPPPPVEAEEPPVERAPVPGTGAARARHRARLADLLLWLVPPLVAWLAVRSWYDAGTFVAAGDVGPFLREGLRADLGDLWGYGLTGAGSATAEVARLVDVLVLDVVGALGGGPEAAQQAFFWLWLTGASAGAVALVRQLVGSRLAAGVAGILVVANPLMAVNLPNPLIATSLCVVGLVGACLLRAARGEQPVALTVLATLPVSYVAINPPTLLVTGLTLGGLAVVAARLAGPGGGRRLGRHLLRAGPWAVLAHLWWLVPLAYLHLGGGPEPAAVTDAGAWSWSHVNNSLANVSALTAHWGWGHHEYLPFSDGLDAAPLSWCRWALPLLALAGPFLAADRRRRRLAVGALALAAVTIVVAKGLHGPLPGLNRILYERVPGMWLLREPMSKVGPLVLGAYLVAGGVAVDGAVARGRRRAGGSRAVLAGVAALVMAALAFGSPVLAGAVAPENRQPLPPSRVEVPAAWAELAAVLDADPRPGKVLVLPTLPFYQATTTWGFHGVATLPRDLLHRPVVMDLPGGYYTDAPVVAELARLVEEGDVTSIDGALDALGVSHVLVRRDLADEQAAFPVDDGAALARRLAATGRFDEVTRYGDVATVLRRAAAPPLSVAPGLARVEADGADSTAAAVAALPPGTVGVDGGEDLPLAASAVAVPTVGGAGPQTVTVAEGGRHDISGHVTGSVTAEARATASGVVLDPVLHVEVDGRPVVAAEGATVPAPPGEVAALGADGTLLAYRDGAVVDLVPGSRVEAYSVAGDPRPVRRWGEVGDCDRQDDAPSGIEGTVEPGRIVLSADRHAACVSAPLPVGPVQVTLQHRVRRGDHGRLCIADPSGCLVDMDLPHTGAWETATVVADLPADAELFVYAEAATGPARVAYREVEVARLEAGAPVTVGPVTFDGAVELDAGDHQVEVIGHVPDRLGPVGPVQDCDHRASDAEVRAVEEGGRLRLSADANAACVRLDVLDVVPGRTYEVSFEHRTVAGRPARWCLWLEGLSRCANRDMVLPVAEDWQPAVERITVPEGAGDLGLYLYADGQDDPITVTEYRDLAVRPAGTTVVLLTPTGGDCQVTIDEQRGEGDRRDVVVTGDGQPLVLAMADSADAGWQLDGLPDGTSARPVVVDGYRQGWVVDGLDGTAHLTLAYGPGRWLDRATAVSLLAIALAVAALVVRFIRFCQQRCVLRNT